MPNLIKAPLIELKLSVNPHSRDYLTSKFTTMSSHAPASSFNIVESSIYKHRTALTNNITTALDLTIAYLLRIAHYDVNHGLNSFTLINPYVISEAVASDKHRASGKPPRALEGIPYTLKDSYKYAGMTVTNGSPALEGLMANEDSHLAAKLRAAGAICLGKTNMPPMAAGGMQRGLYGRAESPYNPEYLTGAFSSGSSNGAATSTAASLAVFGLGSETVSSGRSPGSNCGLVVYTPSRGVLGCKGLWPLYVTCDVPTPMTRTVADMREVLGVIADGEGDGDGDFWRGQKIVELPLSKMKFDSKEAGEKGGLKGKRVGVVKMYIGERDSYPNAKHPYVSPEVIELWKTAKKDLEALGAEVIPTDFPLVTRYEDESICGETNNVVGAPANWSSAERAMVVAKSWDDFLKSNKDPKIKSLQDINTNMLFPKPEGYLPDEFLEVKNLIDYAGLPALAEKYQNTSIYDLPGISQAVQALEAQRKRDFDDWMDLQGFDCVVFPAQGDVGKADLETNSKSAEHTLRNGVKYSNGNRAIRHLGVPSVSVPMGMMREKKMPMNLTFVGRGYGDARVLDLAGAFEEGSKRRVAPESTPALESDGFDRGGSTVKERSKAEMTASVKSSKTVGGIWKISVDASLNTADNEGESSVDVYLNGDKRSLIQTSQGKFELTTEYTSKEPERLDWSLKPMPPRPVMTLVVATMNGVHGVNGRTLDAKLMWSGSE